MKRENEILFPPLDCVIFVWKKSRKELKTIFRFFMLSLSLNFYFYALFWLPFINYSRSKNLFNSVNTWTWTLVSFVPAFKSEHRPLQGGIKNAYKRDLAYYSFTIWHWFFLLIFLILVGWTVCGIPTRQTDAFPEIQHVLSIGDSTCFYIIQLIKNLNKSVVVIWSPLLVFCW